MSDFYKPVVIPNIEPLTIQLNQFFSQPEFSGIFTNGNFMPIVNGLPRLLTELSEFIPALASINLHPSDVTWGVSVTAQAKVTISSIHNNSGPFKYSLEIPLTSCPNAFINFYSSTQPPVLTMKNGIEFPKFDEANCTLLERNPISGPFVLNATIPRTIENDPIQPRHCLTLGISYDANTYIEQLFGFPGTP